MSENTSSKHDVPHPVTKPCCEDEVSQCLSRNPFTETNTCFSKICDIHGSVEMGRYDGRNLRGPPLWIGTTIAVFRYTGKQPEHLNPFIMATRTSANDITIVTEVYDRCTINFCDLFLLKENILERNSAPEITGRNADDGAIFIS